MSALPNDLAQLTELLPAPAQAQDLSSRAQALRQIASQQEFDIASLLLLECQALLKEAEEKFREPKNKAYQAHQSICALEKEFTEPLMQARKRLANLMSGWIQHQQEEQEAANRLAREAAQAAEAEAIERQIEEAESRGATANEVRSILRQTATLPPPVVKQVTRVPGISTRDEWYGEVTDKRAFLQAALRDSRLFELIEWNQGSLNRLVKLLKTSLGDVPGLRIFNRPAVHASRGPGGRIS